MEGKGEEKRRRFNHWSWNRPMTYSASRVFLSPKLAIGKPKIVRVGRRPRRAVMIR